MRDETTVGVGVGPDPDFRWIRVKFLETVSSQTPPNNQEISGKSITSSLPRLKKSGIEYVLLAGSSLCTLSGAQSRYGPGLVPSWWAYCVIFQRLLTILHLKSKKNARPQGHLQVRNPIRIVFELSKDFYWILPQNSLSIGNILVNT